MSTGPVHLWDAYRTTHVLQGGQLPKRVAPQMGTDFLCAGKNTQKREDSSGTERLEGAGRDFPRPKKDTGKLSVAGDAGGTCGCRPAVWVSCGVSGRTRVGTRARGHQPRRARPTAQTLVTNLLSGLCRATLCARWSGRPGPETRPHTGSCEQQSWESNRSP